VRVDGVSSESFEEFQEICIEFIRRNEVMKESNKEVRKT